MAPDGALANVWVRSIRPIWRRPQRYRTASVQAAQQTPARGGARRQAESPVNQKGTVGVPPPQHHDAVAQLIEILRNPASYIEALDAEDALVTMGEPAVQPLLEVFAALQPPGQYLAARALGKIGDPRAATLLMDALQFDSGRNDDCIEWYAAEALARIGEPALGLLISGLTGDNSHVREWSAVALGEMANPLAVDPLLAVAGMDTVQAVRLRALIALGQIGDRRADEPLVELFHDPDIQVRVHAVHAFGWHERGEVLEPLVNVLDDPSDTLRIAAVHALASSAGIQALDLLVRTIDDPAGRVRNAAIMQLGRLGDAHVLPLLELAQHHDRDRLIQDSAASAIERIKKRLGLPEEAANVE